MAPRLIRPGHLSHLWQALAGLPRGGHSFPMSTVAEIKQAVCKLPPRKKQALARWLQSQVDDRLSDAEMMALAAEGAGALDRREAAYAKGRTRRPLAN